VWGLWLLRLFISIRLLLWFLVLYFYFCPKCFNLVLDAHKKVRKREIDTYELERNKPKPSLDHSMIQLQLGYLLKRDYTNQFSLMSELALETLPKGTTPDICIYPK